MAGRSPARNTLKRLKDEGWTAEVTEHWNAFAHIRQDLFGFVDVLAMRDGVLLAVQCTSRSHHAERRNKIEASPMFAELFACGVLIEVWSWVKVKNRWTVKQESLTAAR